MKTYIVKPISQPFKKSIKAPSSKSYTNRALLIASLAEGKSKITNCLLSDDTKVMIEALKQLGVKINQTGNDFEIEGTDGFKSIEKRELSTELNKNSQLPACTNSGRSDLTTQLYLGNAGTAVRSLTAAMTLAPFDTIITGDKRMLERPISDLVNGLHQLGAQIKYTPPCPPLLIHKNTLKGGTCKIPGNKSSQYFSAIMISGPYGKEEVTIEVIGDLVSKPYIDMTIQIIENFGGKVINENYKKFTISNEHKFYAQNYEIEADAGSASYFFGIGAATANEITISNAKYDSLQGEIKFVDVLEKMGCKIRTENRELRTEKGITVTGSSQLSALETLDLNHMPDTAMTVAILCSLAKGKSILTGLQNLRIKETDRLKGLTTELKKVGVKVKELDDGLEIDGYPEKLHGAEIETYDDHRMAMCFAVLGTKIPGIVIKNPDCVNKTYPDFWKDLEKLSS